MKFHLMTSSCLFKRGTTFSQTVTYNSNVFLLADTKSIVQTRTTLFNKSRQNNVLQQRWRLNHRCQAKFLTCEISDFTAYAHAQSNILHILWRTQKISEGAKFRHNRVTSQINFRGCAEGTTILGGPGACPRENTHFCAFWKQVWV